MAKKILIALVCSLQDHFIAFFKNLQNSENFSYMIFSFSGVAIAAMALSFTGKLSINCTELSHENFHGLVNEIDMLSTKFYEMGLLATKDDFQHNIEPAVDTFIEVGSIRDGVTIDGRNIIKINESLAMTILPPWNVPLINNNHELLDYIEIWTASEFPDIFHRFMDTRTNAIVMFEDHYVTILKFDQQFLLVNGLPQFSFRTYDSIDSLIKDLIGNVGETKFVLMHARKCNEHTLGKIKHFSLNSCCYNFCS